MFSIPNCSGKSRSASGGRPIDLPTIRMVMAQVIGVPILKCLPELDEFKSFYRVLYTHMLWTIQLRIWDEAWIQCEIGSKVDADAWTKWTICLTNGPTIWFIIRGSLTTRSKAEKDGRNKSENGYHGEIGTTRRENPEVAQLFPRWLLPTTSWHREMASQRDQTMFKIIPYQSSK